MPRASHSPRGLAFQSAASSLAVGIFILFTHQKLSSGTMLPTRDHSPQDSKVRNIKYKVTMGCGSRNHWLREKVKLLQNNQEVILGSDLAKNSYTNDWQHQFAIVEGLVQQASQSCKVCKSFKWCHSFDSPTPCMSCVLMFAPFYRGRSRRSLKVTELVNVWTRLWTCMFSVSVLRQAKASEEVWRQTIEDSEKTDEHLRRPGSQHEMNKANRTTTTQELRPHHRQPKSRP